MNLPLRPMRKWRPVITVGMIFVPNATGNSLRTRSGVMPSLASHNGRRRRTRVSSEGRQKTTVIPHLEASHLVQSGIFSRTRNPIYLGDALVLTGLVLRFDAVLSLVLVPAFVWIIERRFEHACRAASWCSLRACFDRWKGFGVRT